jgi:hypothetical protein
MGGQVCFKSNAGWQDPNHGFDNFATASLTIIAVFFQKNWSGLMADCVEISTGMEVFVLKVTHSQGTHQRTFFASWCSHTIRHTKD